MMVVSLIHRFVFVKKKELQTINNNRETNIFMGLLFKYFLIFTF